MSQKNLLQYGYGVNDERFKFALRWYKWPNNEVKKNWLSHHIPKLRYDTGIKYTCMTGRQPDATYPVKKTISPKEVEEKIINVYNLIKNNRRDEVNSYGETTSDAVEKKTGKRVEIKYKANHEYSNFLNVDFLKVDSGDNQLLHVRATGGYYLIATRLDIGDTSQLQIYKIPGREVYRHSKIDEDLSMFPNPRWDQDIERWYKEDNSRLLFASRKNKSYRKQYPWLNKYVDENIKKKKASTTPNQEVRRDREMNHGGIPGWTAPGRRPNNPYYKPLSRDTVQNILFPPKGKEQPKDEWWMVNGNIPSALLRF